MQALRHPLRQISLLSCSTHNASLSASLADANQDDVLESEKSGNVPGRCGMLPWTRATPNAHGAPVQEDARHATSEVQPS